MSRLIITLLGIYTIACTPSSAGDTDIKASPVSYQAESTPEAIPAKVVKQNPEGTQVIHVFVALCDNEYQGIVPVPKGIGNGQNENTNLYWGCGYGVRTYFKNSANWKHISSVKNSKTHVLERCVFKHKATGAILVADAYDGQYMRHTLAAFFNAGAGVVEDSVMIDSTYYYAGGASELVAFVGHNGLMDVYDMTTDEYTKQDTLKRDAMLLCCSASYYFGDYLKKLEMYPVLWTTHLMAPEAYTLHDAIETWLKGGTGLEIETAAATAYNKYQKCGMRGAMNLFKTGY